jgi:pectin-derived oligosaccharide transport system substrate-binding protein
MHAKRFWFMAAALLIFSMLAAQCGAPAPTAPPAAPAPTAAPAAAAAPAPAATAAPAAASGETIELRMAWWGSQNRHDRTLKVIDMFQKEHPNITITSEYMGFGDYWTKMATEAAGNNLPDIMQQDYAYIAQYISKGLLMPLDGYVADGKIKLDKVDEKQITGGKMDGKLYAVNLGTNSQTLVFDPALFEKAGVKLPGPDWTWAEFEQTAIQLHEKLGIYGMGESLYDRQIFKMWLKEHGKWLYNADGTALGYDDDKLFADFFHMILRLQKAGVAPTREFDAARANLGVEDQLIVKEQAAIAQMWSNQVVAVSKAAGDRPLQLGLFPQGGAGATEGHYLKPSQFFSITSQSKHPEEAALFIDYFTNSIEANKVLMAERGVPISADVRQALQPLLKPAEKATFDFISLVEQHSSPIPPPDPPAEPKIISDAYNPIVDQILYGQITPEEGAKLFREQATALLTAKK